MSDSLGTYGKKLEERNRRVSDSWNQPQTAIIKLIIIVFSIAMLVLSVVTVIQIGGIQ